MVEQLWNLVYRLRSRVTNIQVPKINKPKDMRMIIARLMMGEWRTTVAYSGLPK